jgi:cell division protease FtsH
MSQNDNHNQQPNQQPNQPGPRRGGRPRMPGGIWRLLIWVVLAAAFAPWLWSQLGGTGAVQMEVPYTTFREQVDQGNVTKVLVQGDEITGEFSTPVQVDEPGEDQPVDVESFRTYVPSFGDDTLLSDLRAQGVEVDTQPESGISWLAILVNILPLLLLLGLGYMFFNRARSQGQGVFSMGKSGARLYDRRDERTTFSDVAGARGAKTELEEIIEFLKDPSRFEKLGGEIPKGVLLVGPPGTGKTLLARAVAGEAGVPFFSITGSDFMEMFVGVGASRVRDLFEEAKKVSPAIIFIDELDSIGRMRGAGLGGGHDEREQTLNQLLSELDGFNPNENVIVMAATNRPDILDSALLRPGRFDRQITVDLPTMHDRVEILKIHARNKPLSPDVNLERIARGSPGFSGADLKNLLNEAALLAARQDKSMIEEDDIEEARDKILLGLERENLALTKDELELLAYHEGGHTVVAAVVPNAEPIHKVTIVPRGRAMGVTQQLPERDKYLYSRDYMLDRLAVMMGGRAAEDLVLNTATSGAANDLQQATQLARKMVLDWGMSEKLGHVALGTGREQVFLGEQLTQLREYSETTAREVDEEVRRIVEEAYARARQILKEHRPSLDRLADALLEREEIPGDEVTRLLDIAPPEDGQDHRQPEETPA